MVTRQGLRFDDGNHLKSVIPVTLAIPNLEDVEVLAQASGLNA